jgi:hypothetical protein
MVKKWTITAIAYLLIVMGGYEIYSVALQPDTPPQQHIEETEH